ncbi:MAG: permease-like cell division protein FtsX [Clostridia bacterium]|nr:permease-like cell division protein FtsX [Clostridia bacterium]
MKFRSVKYYTKQATGNVFANGWMSIASVFTVIASLLVFGVFFLLTLNLNYIASQFEGDYEIILVVDENYTFEQTEQLRPQIEAIEFIENVTFDSKESRLDDLKQDMGDNAYLFDGYAENNPLRDWYKVTLTDLSQSETVVAQIESIEGIVKVIFNQDTIDSLLSATDYLSNISIWIMVALGIISIFIISNTIKLTVFSRAKEINIMKYVGATDWFIRWPFIIEGIIIGLVGSAVSLLIISFGYNGLTAFFGTLGISFVSFKPISQILPYLIPMFLLLGIILGGIGSLISVRKHLKV